MKPSLKAIKDFFNPAAKERAPQYQRSGLLLVTAPEERSPQYQRNGLLLRRNAED